MPKILLPALTSASLFDCPNGDESALEIRLGEDRWCHFVSAYRQAADQLAELCVSNPWRHEYLAAPMMFLYRHYVELYLKSLLLDSGELLDEPQQVPARHYLLQLWERVRHLLLRISPGSDGPWFARADAIISEFDTIDPSSFVFRYPVDTKGAPSLGGRLAVDAENVRSIVSELSILLDGASAQIDEYMGFKHDAF